MKNKNFGNTLRSIRISAGYKQEDAARSLFLARSTYSHYEAGYRVPTIDVLIRISALFNANPLQLIIPLIPSEIYTNNPSFKEIIHMYSDILLPDISNLIIQYHKLSKEEKNSILKTMYLFNKAHE